MLEDLGVCFMVPYFANASHSLTYLFYYEAFSCVSVCFGAFIPVRSWGRVVVWGSGLGRARGPDLVGLEVQVLVLLLPQLAAGPCTGTRKECHQKTHRSRK